MRFSFHHTHAYPGCGVTVEEDGIEPGALVDFVDGAVCAGRYAYRPSGEIELVVEPYVTARGTAIARKRWLLKSSGGAREWKVAARLDASAA